MSGGGPIENYQILVEILDTINGTQLTVATAHQIIGPKKFSQGWVFDKYNKKYNNFKWP